MFEVGPEGIRRDDGTARDEGPQARRLDIITLGAVVLLLGIMAWQYLSPAFVEGPPAPGATVEPAEPETTYYAPESPEEGRRGTRSDLIRPAKPGRRRGGHSNASSISLGQRPDRI